VAGLGVLLALVAAVALAGRRNWAPPVVHREDVSTGAGGVEPRRVLIPITIGLFFVYTAAEGSTGTWAFSVLTGPRGMARGEAGVVVAGYWAMFTLGRLAVAAIGHRWPTHRSCSAGLVLGLVAVAVFWANPGHWGWIGLPVAGFGFAPAFPVIISLVPAWIGRKRAAGIIGWCIAAGALGSPIATAVAGGLAGRAGVGWVPAVFTAAAAVTVVVHESAWALAGR
jgi:fucose permease